MLTVSFALLSVAAGASAPPTWSPAAGPLQTRWTAGVVAAATGPGSGPGSVADNATNNASGVWNTYPRPQFARAADTWQSLNGLWEYAIRVRPTDGSQPGPRIGAQPGSSASAKSTPLTFPSRADGTILVPFPVESQLSGVGKPVPADSELFYRRSFDIAADYKAAGARTLLHFGAVDWYARVSVNGKTVGEHAGGFDAFSFDITDLVKPGANELVVSAWDPTDTGTQPRGKQVLKPGGIFYTAVTGIWQTVWLERVPGLRVQSFAAETDRKTGSLAMQIALDGDTKSAGALTIQVLAPNGTEAASIKVAPPEARLSPRILLPDIRAWSPDSPALYDIVLTLSDKSGAVTDRVRTYCAFRDVAVVRDGDGPARIELNGKPIFMLGLLDQGWWPDGLLTPPSHEAMLYDLQATLDCGFNTIRKHVKVEPATWYAACDRLGILVWQDMPSGDKSIGPNDADMTRTDASARAYERELAAMVEQLRPFPSVVLWVPFNEGWGQFDSARITDSVRALDATRIVTTASGWSDRNTGDVFDVHDYAPRLAGRVPTSTGGRAWVIGECGGFGLPMPGHLWASSGWGYTSYKDCDALTRAYEQLAADLLGLRADGLCAAIYTQTTDVETEVNGLMTYDRDVLKVNSARVAAANRALIQSAVSFTPPVTVVTTALDAKRAGKMPPDWSMTLSKPGDGWTESFFDTSAWTIARGGFGSAGTPGTDGLIGTPWSSSDIWLRRNVAFPVGDPLPTHLVVNHDEDADIWLDGRKVAELKGFTGGYVRVALPAEIASRLKHGNHVLAVHCRQTTGGQFIDVGLCAVPSYTGSK